MSEDMDNLAHRGLIQKMEEKTMNQQFEKFVKALVAVQKELEAAKTTASNPFFKSRYAPLAEVWRTCKDVLSKHGFAVCQTLGRNDGRDVLITELMHEAGGFRASFYPIYPAKPNDPQAFQSAVTYARRGGLSAIIGLTTTEADDDGERAMARTNPKQEFAKTREAVKAYNEKLTKTNSDAF